MTRNAAKSTLSLITLVNNKFSSENSLSELDTVFYADSRYVLSFFPSRQVSKMRAAKISGKIRKNFAKVVLYLVVMTHCKLFRPHIFRAGSFLKDFFLVLYDCTYFLALTYMKTCWDNNLFIH